jgi:hypothetical protein
MSKKKEAKNLEIDTETESEEYKNFVEGLKAIFSLPPEKVKEIIKDEPDEEEEEKPT